MGPAVAHPAEMAGMGAPRLRFAQADLDREAVGAQPRMALPRHLRIGILDRRDHPRNPRGDDGVGARRRLAVMGAGFERHIERRPAGAGAGARQRLDLRMGTPARLRPAAADDHRRIAGLIDHDGADRGIGPGVAEPAAAEREREVHEALVQPLVVGRKGHRVASGPSAAPARALESARQTRAERPSLRHPAGKIHPHARLTHLKWKRGGPRAAPLTLRVWLQDQNG